mgnify:CR=1 FL=1
MISLAAEPIAHIAGFPITNSMVNAWIAVIFFVIVAAVASRRRGLVPKGIHNVIEAVVEFLLTEARKVTGDRARAKTFLPIVATIFLFVLVLSNSIDYGLMSTASTKPFVVIPAKSSVNKPTPQPNSRTEELEFRPNLLMRK